MYQLTDSMKYAARSQSRLRRAAGLVLLVGMLLAVSACDSSVQPPVPEPPAQPGLSLVLRVHADQQHALLTEVRAADQNRPYSNAPFDALLQTAELRVNETHFQVRPADSVDYDRSPYNYYADALVVEPGRTYDLHVQLENHNLVRGQTTVPGAFAVRAAGRRITWSASEGAARYRLLIYAPDDSPSGYYVDTFTTDTSYTVQAEGDFVPGAHVVRIQAQNQPYVAFSRDETAQAGLEGAFGVFGAVTTVSETVVL